jgi:SAM-dependent methyltransferase
MSDMDRLVELFEVDGSVVSALPDDALAMDRWKVHATSRGLRPDAERSPVTERLWARKDYARSQGLQFGVEYLVPRIRQEIHGAWPAFTQRRRGHLDMSRADLHAAVAELRPWTIPYQLADGVNVSPYRNVAAAEVVVQRLLYRRDLISQTVSALLGSDAAQTSVLDIGCQNGFFSMDLADLGVGQVKGIDLRPNNIAQAHFLQEYFGVENVEFSVCDIDALGSREQWDVVVNLGVLYQVVNPLPFVRRTYELCRRFAVIDTVTHREPISGYFLVGERDVSNPGEGRESYELHPTYRGAIDTIRYAGFRDVLEIVGNAETTPEVYQTGQRRCFLAIK